MVPWPVTGPLPVQPLRYPQNAGILHLRVDRTFPPNFPAPKHVPAPTTLCTHGRTGGIHGHNMLNSQRAAFTQIVAIQHCKKSETPPSTATPRTEQRVGDKQQMVREEQQRVIDETPILTIPQITAAPPILNVRNLTAKQVLKTTP